MSLETFLSGYCRVLDQSRMVAVEVEDGEASIDCAYGSCPHSANCPIGKQIRRFLEENGLSQSQNKP